jgi:hypothetical protein
MLLHGERTHRLLAWMEELLRVLRNTLGAGRLGSVDAATAALPDLEAAETTQFVAAGEQSCPERGVSGSLLRLARLTALVLGVAQLVRTARMRTRMYGGVAGKDG